MSLLKTDTTVNLEKRVEVLEKQMNKLLKVVGKSTLSDSENTNQQDNSEDDYCSIS
jgi:hypothetical protein